MRLETLKFIVCPNCAGDLILSSDAPRPAEDGHILTGNLACRACASRFAIRNGVPILLPANLASVKLEKGRTYVIWLNSEKFENFKDASGNPAVPYLLVFETKPFSDHPAAQRAGAPSQSAGGLRAVVASAV